MKLYLMQHALAYPVEENSERPLTPEGVEQAKAAASGVKRLGISFDLIITSPKRRAQQTAALIAEAVRYPYSDIVATDAVLPKAAPTALPELLQKEESALHVLVVGHQPHLSIQAGFLLNGAELLFDNAGLTCLEILDTRVCLAFHLTPQQLAG